MPPPRRSRKTLDAVRALLAGEEIFATTAYVLFADLILDQLLDRGETDPRVLSEKLNEAYTWHPTVIRHELGIAYNANVSDVTVDRLLAGITVATTDLFFKDVRRFIVLANILAGDEFDPEIFDPADSAECAWAVTEALLLNPPDDDDPEPFSDDIRRYIGAVLADEGYVTPPDILRIALDADFSDRVSYDFTDDPEMFQGIYQTQQGKTAEIADVIREGLASLSEQLESLPLRRGDTSDMVNKLRAALRQKEEASEL